MDERKFLFAYDRRRTSTLTLDEQPGAHAGATRQYIPGYSSSNIVYLNTATGNDGNTGASIAQAVQTYSQAATLAGTTKKIRLVNSATLSTNITKPTEATIGTSSTIASPTSAIDVWTAAGTPSFSTTEIEKVIFADGAIDKFIAVGRSGKIGYSSNGNAWTQAGTPSFSTSIIFDVAFNGSILVAVGESGKIATSTDGDTWAQRTSGLSGNILSIVYSEILDLFVASAAGSYIIYSSDGITWHLASGRPVGMIDNIAANLLAIQCRADTGMLVAGSTLGDVYYSYDANTWFVGTNPSNNTIYSITWNPVRREFLATNNTSNTLISSDGITWAESASTYGGKDSIYIPQYNQYLMGYTGTYEIIYSSDGITWVEVGTPAITSINGLAYSESLGIAVAVGTGGVISYATLISINVSADIAGFSVSSATYSGTVKAYNCTLIAPVTSAALSTINSRVSGVSHITNNAVMSYATLFTEDRKITCTPAAQNDIDMNLDTVGGTWYIYNASQTGYERIRDCIVESGIVANYPVTVSGRANTRGTSENVLFGATVTHNDPKFVDTTDYALQFQTNGYDKNSPAAGRSAIYFNSSGGARDIGAWSYIESAVSYYYAKSRYLYKGQDISHGLEFNLTEQQGDSGVMNVYGNTQRIKEVLTMQYGSTQEEERAVFYEMLTLKDKGVKITFAEWEDNTGTVTVNGNQSAGAEFLTVDAVQVFNGMTVTIAGKVYSVMRASPNMTAATKLILDRPTTDAVSDNDVLTTNYPSGQGEYQFSGPTNITMKQNAATGLTGWRTGFAIRLIRKYQG